MKSNDNAREILLLQNTRFLLRNWLQQKSSFEQKYNASKDQLKEACWNGLVQEILPECFDASCSMPDVYLWDVIDAKAFIGLNYCNGIPPTERKLSLDPHIFMSVLDYN